MCGASPSAWCCPRRKEACEEDGAAALLPTPARTKKHQWPFDTHIHEYSQGDASRLGGSDQSPFAPTSEPPKTRSKEPLMPPHAQDQHLHPLQTPFRSFHEGDPNSTRKEHPQGQEAHLRESCLLITPSY